MNLLSNKLAWFLLAFSLMFLGTGAVGLVGPDEPRYADVARTMMRSGDYITPRLFGTPWFEKPPLYYWTAALFFRLGVSELTARLPSVLAAIGFLGLWYWFARRMFQFQVAAMACILLGSTAGWVGFAHGAVTDMLFSATLDAAIVFMALWFWEREPQYIYSFYALLGLAVLAKGPAAIVLAGLIALGYVLVYRDWKSLLQLMISPGIGLFALVAVPWYALCYYRNGFVFIQEFIIKHNLERYTSEALGHPQPVWFYLPVIAAGLFPWTPLLVLPVVEAVRPGIRSIFENRRKGFLLCWIALPFVFFSLAKNKLPGYLLPVLPPLTLWFALIMEGGRQPASEESQDAEGQAKKKSKAAPKPEPPIAETGEESTFLQRLALWLVGLSALLLLTVPLFLPEMGVAITSGVREAFARWHPSAVVRLFRGGPVQPVAILFLLAPIVFCFYFLWRRDLLQAAFLVAAGAGFIMMGIVGYMAPEIDRLASMRSVAQHIERMNISGQEVALHQVKRTQALGLSYYLEQNLPEWNQKTSPDNIHYVLANDEATIPDAQGMSLFPGAHLRLWNLLTHFEIELAPPKRSEADR